LADDQRPAEPPVEAELFNYADDPVNHGKNISAPASYAQMVARLKMLTGQDFSDEIQAGQRRIADLPVAFLPPR